MKYAFLVVLVLIILRIDMFVGVVERAWKKLPEKKPQEVIEPIETPSVSTLAVADLQQNQVSQFQLLLTEFTYNPDRPTRDLIVDYLKKNSSLQTINSDMLYSGLEKWASLVKEENPEVLLLLNEMMDIFQGNSQKVIQQFYSSFLDENPEFFFHYYPILKDPNCLVAKNVWNISNTIDLELLNERKSKIEGLADRIEPSKLEFSKNCLLVIRVETAKLSQPSEDL